MAYSHSITVLKDQLAAIDQRMIFLSELRHKMFPGIETECYLQFLVSVAEGYRIQREHLQDSMKKLQAGMGDIESLVKGDE